MDIEKIKKSSKWDPSTGDYSGKDASLERRLSKRKKTRNILLISFYVLVVVAAIVFLFVKYK